MLPNKMLVAYDGSAASHRALRVAESICRVVPWAEVVLAHVIPIEPSRMGAVVAQGLVLEEAEKTVEELTELAEAISNTATVLILRGSSPADLIVHCAEEEGCDLIIMGSRGQGGVRGYLGSVSRRVVVESPIDVYIAKCSD